MKKPRFRSEDVDQALLDADEMTPEALGAYTRIKWALWRHGGRLTKDPSKLAKVAKMNARQWRRVRLVLTEKLRFDGDHIFHPHITAQLEFAHQRMTRTARLRDLRGDKSLKSHASNQDLSRGNNVSVKESSITLTPRQAAAFWLGDQGARWLASATGMRAMQAQKQIARWDGVLDDPERLADMLKAVQDENLRGAMAVRVLDQRVMATATVDKKGLPLPFGPQLIKRA
jgi:uncharacterized protein YdaU (DUF1376 family)